MRRVVAITGASAGIGRATALRLARERAALVICARRPEPLEGAADEIRHAGGEVLAVRADVTHEAEMICNAGFAIYGAIDQIEPARMQQLGIINAMAPQLTDRLVQRWGRKPV